MDSTSGFTPYIPNTHREQKEMLQAIGVSSLEELFADIPNAFRNPPIDLPDAMSELELRRKL